MATPTATRVPREAYDVYAISQLDGYIAAAQAGQMRDGLGPLLALSILADKQGLAGQELQLAVCALADALARDGHHRAASELLGAAIQAFAAGQDHQSVADLAETLAVLSRLVDRLPKSTET